MLPAVVSWAYSIARLPIIHKPLEHLRKIGFVLRVYNYKLSIDLFLPSEHEPLGLGALQRGAHIDPACAVLAALVGRLQLIGQALVMASSPRRRWVRER